MYFRSPGVLDSLFLTSHLDLLRFTPVAEIAGMGIPNAAGLPAGRPDHVKDPIVKNNRRVASQTFVAPSWGGKHDVAVAEPFKVQPVFAVGEINSSLAIPQKIGQQENLFVGFRRNLLRNDWNRWCQNKQD